VQRQRGALCRRHVLDEPNGLGRHIRTMRRFLLGLALCALVPVMAQATTPAATVRMHNDAFAPLTVTVHTGDTVRWTNDDDDAHTVTAMDGSFDSKGIDSNGSWSHTFTKPGTYKYFCELHPFMKATIVVKDAKS
jgi:plastocyanin